jgi:tetratricopeptide (TPR) repeat protein
VALATLGRYAEAEALHSEPIELTRELLGSKHPDLFVPLGNVANLQFVQANYEQAIPYFRESLEIGAAFLPAQNDLMLRGRVLLGKCLISTGHYQEAEHELLQVHELAQEHASIAKVVATRAREALVTLYEETNQTDKAAQLRESLTATPSSQPSMRDPHGTRRRLDPVLLQDVGHRAAGRVRRQCKSG